MNKPATNPKPSPTHRAVTDSDSAANSVSSGSSIREIPQLVAVIRRKSDGREIVVVNSAIRADHKFVHSLLVGPEHGEPTNE